MLDRSSQLTLEYPEQNFPPLLDDVHTPLCRDTRTEYLAAHSSSLKVVIGGEAFLETMPGLDSRCQHSIPRGNS